MSHVAYLRMHLKTLNYKKKEIRQHPLQSMRNATST